MHISKVLLITLLFALCMQAGAWWSTPKPETENAGGWFPQASSESPAEGSFKAVVAVKMDQALKMYRRTWAATKAYASMGLEFVESHCAVASTWTRNQLLAAKKRFKVVGAISDYFESSALPRVLLGVAIGSLLFFGCAQAMPPVRRDVSSTDVAKFEAQEKSDRDARAAAKAADIAKTAIPSNKSDLQKEVARLREIVDAKDKEIESLKKTAPGSPDVMNTITHTVDDLGKFVMDLGDNVVSALSPARPKAQTQESPVKEVHF